MIDKNTVGIIKKPHIYYNTWIKHWVCQSEDGPWNICISSPRSYRIGAGESVLEAYGDWLLKLIGNDVRIDLGNEGSAEIADEVIKVIGRMSGDGSHQS